jgi:hypothetical protein
LTNQKQELPVAAMFVNGSEQNEISFANYNGEPRDIPNIYLIRIFSAILLNDNWN